MIFKAIRKFIYCSEANITLRLNPVHWNLIPKFRCGDPRADVRWIYGKFCLEMQFKFLCICVDVFLDSGSEDDLDFL